jgi:glycosyltransferase involved in cell wall biosynthesis
VKISIITPTKNRASTFLPDLIRSIERQELKDGWSVEHVICDDGSSPEEYTLLQQLSAASSIPTTVVRHAASRRVAAARNSALRASTGDIILDIDDDDVLPEGALVLRVEHLMQSKALWSFCNAFMVDEQLRALPAEVLVQDWEHNALSGAEVLEALLTNRAWFWAGTRTYKREALFTKDGIVAWDDRYVVADDLDHWIHLTSLVGSPAHLPEFGILWRKKESSLGINMKRSGVMDEEITDIQHRWQQKRAKNV